jgi:hypothetical protein
MMYLYYLLFVVGLVSYGLALFNHAPATHACYTDTGHALLLITAVLLLIRIAYRVQRAGNTPK